MLSLAVSGFLFWEQAGGCAFRAWLGSKITLGVMSGIRAMP